MSANLPTFEVRRLRSEDEAAVLAFELENRAYFARYINDRGDEFYEQFSARHRDCLDEQDAGLCAFHVLIEPDGSVLGRVNLYDLAADGADLGYRIAQRAAGRGVATAAVAEVVRLAEQEYGLRLLRAVVADGNASSKRVLEKTEFVPVGAAKLNGGPATRYERRLSG